MEISSNIKHNIIKAQNKLSNQIVRMEIKKQYRDIDFDLNRFDTYIEYLSNLDTFSIKYNDVQIEEISRALETFLHITENTSRIRSKHVKLLDSINSIVGIVKSTSKTISKDEFNRRYDKLVTTLNTIEMKSSLTLTTAKDKLPFEVYKNTNNSLIILSGKEKTQMVISKEKLVEIAFDDRTPTYKSYEQVIIDKIIDNSIFNNILPDPLVDITDFRKGGLKDPQLEIRNKETLKKLKKNIDDLENEGLKSKGKISNLEDILEHYSENFNNLRNLIEKAENIESDYVNAKNAALKNIELQKSYKFWEIQEKSYASRYWLYLLVTMIVVVIFLLSVGYYVNNIESVEQNQIANNENNTTTTQTKQESEVSRSDDNFKFKKLFKYGFLVLLTSMIIWIIRILMKITLSNYHLSIDARERIIMIRTYLALIKEGKGFAEDDKKVILDNIFRPTNFGIIKDETHITPADILGAMKK